VKNGNDAATRRILDADPDCALVRNAEGYVPLHFAVHDGHLATAITLSTRVPDCARIQCENGCLPLHDAVSMGARHPDTPQIVTALQHAFKDAVFVTNDEGLLPIHLAASSGFEVGLRTLLSAEFSTIFVRDKLEQMLPVDVAVHELAEIEGEEAAELDEAQDVSSDRNRIISCVEILLSSMFYNRLVAYPREFGSGDKPFLPLHSAVDACHQTWKTLFSLYGEEHGLDVDPLGRNVAHRICSRPIENVNTDLSILGNLDNSLFIQSDDYGFIPLHLSLQNKNAPFQFVMAVAGRHKSSLSLEVQPVRGNIYAHFLPVQIASAAGCDLNIILFIMKSHPLAVLAVR